MQADQRLHHSELLSVQRIEPDPDDALK